MNKYLVVWYMLAGNALQVSFVNRWTNLIFIVGKITRFATILLLLWLIKDQVDTIASYSSAQLLVFFLTYQIIDAVGQILYRGVYEFGHQVKSGSFDLILTKPVNCLFLSLIGKPDINDALLFLPLIGVSALVMHQAGITLSLSALGWIILLSINSFLLITALHIWVLTVGILTTEVDGIVWFMRDALRMGQLPISVYQEPIRTLLFFLIPIGLMVTIPAEVIASAPPSYTIGFTCAIGVCFFLLSLTAWNWSVKRYTSASS